jgi:predicted nuclease of predicted toxin-antitoxin system
LPDSDIVVKAAMEKRVLLTSDLDFGYLVAISRSSLPSIVLFRLSDMRPMTVTSHLDNVLLQHESELAKGALIVVTDSRIRVRLLPIGRDLTDKI